MHRRFAASSARVRHLRLLVSAVRDMGNGFGAGITLGAGLAQTSRTSRSMDRVVNGRTYWDTSDSWLDTAGFGTNPAGRRNSFQATRRNGRRHEIALCL